MFFDVFDKKRFKRQPASNVQLRLFISHRARGLPRAPPPPPPTPCHLMTNTQNFICAMRQQSRWSGNQGTLPPHLHTETKFVYKSTVRDLGPQTPGVPPFPKTRFGLKVKHFVREVHRRRFLDSPPTTKSVTITKSAPVDATFRFYKKVPFFTIFEVFYFGGFRPSNTWEFRYFLRKNPTKIGEKRELFFPKFTRFSLGFRDANHQIRTC